MERRLRCGGIEEERHRNPGEFSASIAVVTSTSGYAGALLGTPQFLIEPPRNKRMSVGIRSLADPVEITAFLLAPDHTERARTTRQYAADFYEQTPLGSWFNDLQQPGDSILFLVRPGSSSSWTAGAIVFLAETDNVTNDVTIVAPTELQTLSQPIVVFASGAGVLGVVINDARRSCRRHVEADRIHGVHEAENCRPKRIPLRFPAL